MTIVSSNTVVNGTVVYYDDNRRFGFARITVKGDRGNRVERVFFHQGACRHVEGTPEDPILTQRSNDRQPLWFPGQRRSEQIVLQVVQGPKGLKAAAWGYRPERTWQEDLVHADVLSRYNGGEVSFIYSDRPHGRSNRQVKGRLLVAPELIPGDPWELTLTYVEYDSFWSDHQIGPVVTRTFRLNEVRSSKHLNYGRYGMDLYVDQPHGAGEWAHIVFFPPEQ